MRSSQIFAFLSSILTHEKLKKHSFNYNYQHHTIKYKPTIALIELKKIKTFYQFRRVAAINFSFDDKCSHPVVNQGLSAALNTADQVLNSLLSGDDIFIFRDG